MNDIEEVLGNAKVVFGLKRQGHIPAIERMLKEGKNWDDIGAAINWCPITAREHYERYLHRPEAIQTVWFEVENEVCPLLARAVEMLRKFGSKPDVPVWDRNNIASLIFQAEQHLLSTSSKTHPILKPQDDE
jgi:hypothetical protein